MYKNLGHRSVELVFYGNRLKKSIGQRRPTADLLRELNDDMNNEQAINDLDQDPDDSQ